MQHILLTLEAPLMSFGREKIDQNRPTWDFPGLSMITGLLSNALGYPRWDPRIHQLQQRIKFACRIDRQTPNLRPLKEYQTATLRHRDMGWTTKGVPESRGGGPKKYNAPHVMHLEFHADMMVTVSLRLEPEDQEPNLQQLVEALNHPAHPLFIGRKCCLPSRPIFTAWADAPTSLDAVLNAAPEDPGTLPAFVRVSWSNGDGDAMENGVDLPKQVRTADRTDEASQLHSGHSTKWHGQVPRERITI